LLGIRLDAARARVAELVGPTSGETSSSPPFTPRAKKVLELALRESLQLGDPYVGTEHLLLGLVREGEGVGARVLVSFGPDLAQLRQQVIRLIAERIPAPSGEAPRGREWLSGRWANDPVAGEGQRGRLPRCPGCSAALADTARYRLIEVPPADGETGDVVSVPVVYCTGCGCAVVTYQPPLSGAAAAQAVGQSAPLPRYGAAGWDDDGSGYTVWSGSVAAWDHDPALATSIGVHQRAGEREVAVNSLRSGTAGLAELCASTLEQVRRFVARAHPPEGSLDAEPGEVIALPGDEIAPGEAVWETVAITVDGTPVDFAVTHLEGGWAAVGQGPQSTLTVAARGVALGEVSLVRLPDLPAPAPGT